jgi:hypothetical protein
MGLTAFRNGMTENAQTKNTTAVLTNTHGTQARSLASRFDVPWDYVKPLRAKTPTESNNRYLYSPTAPSSTDGIGHAMAQVNAEITTALTLGITYTHRVSSFGSLTLDENSSAVEEFFGWGVGEIPRSKVQEDVCNVAVEFSYLEVNGVKVSNGRACPLCRSLRDGNDGHHLDKSALHVTRAVDVPPELSFNPGISCGGRFECANEFMKRINGSTPGTLFRMSDERCGLLKSLSTFRYSAPWFYTKYWEAHGLLKSPTTGQWLPRLADARNHVAFSDNQLIVAVHVRRGDFLQAKNRRLTKSEVFAKVIKSFVGVVQAHGGKFADLPLAVYIYSEGKQRTDMTKAKGSTHDITTLTSEFVDIGGKVQNSSWWEALIRNAIPQSDLRHTTTSTPIDVHMRVSTDTLTSLHEMAAADVFIGSDSGMSWNVIGSLSRGVQLQSRKCSEWRCFENDTGHFSRELFLKRWAMYADMFVDYLP